MRMACHEASWPAVSRAISAGGPPRLGSHTASTLPMFPSLSAYSMFWPGTAKPSKAARNSSKSRARLTASMAPISSLASWPVHFRASGGRSRSASSGASLTIGPHSVSRTVTSLSNHQRTPMLSLRSAISEAGTPLTS